MDDRGEKQEPTLFPDRTARIGKAKENGRRHTYAHTKERKRERERIFLIKRIEIENNKYKKEEER